MVKSCNARVGALELSRGNTMMERCYKKDGVWIPGCFSRAHCESDCSCPPRTGTNRDIAIRMDELELQVAALTRRVLEIGAKQ